MLGSGREVGEVGAGKHMHLLGLVGVPAHQGRSRALVPPMSAIRRGGMRSETAVDMGGDLILSRLGGFD